MSETKVAVPEGMFKAASDEFSHCRTDGAHLSAALEAALRWLSENPIVPTDEQAHELWKVALELDPDRNENDHAAKNLVIEWQRIMFRDVVPEAIKDLLMNPPSGESDPGGFKEAYRRGRDQAQQ